MLPGQLAPESESLGYTLYPPAYPGSPGHPRLDVVLRDRPTGLHFDPEKLSLLVATSEHDIQHITITHPRYAESHQLQAVAGRMVLEDRVNKHVEFFTLGGPLIVSTEQSFTLCTLTSPAPIIELGLLRCVPEMLAEEIDALLARRRAFWEGHPREFDKRLIAAHPLVLYAACLVAFEENLRVAPHHQMDELTGHFSYFLRDEIEYLQATTGQDVSTLSVEHIL